VLDVLGGIIIVFGVPRPSSPSTSSSSSQTTNVEARPTREETRQLLREVGKVVRDGLGGWEWDGVGLGVGVSGTSSEDEVDSGEWEDVCNEFGLEFVNVKPGASSNAKNEFGGMSSFKHIFACFRALRISLSVSTYT
jgi:alpha- and gamma-adaptin-binding protein p34